MIKYIDATHLPESAIYYMYIGCKNVILFSDKSTYTIKSTR